MTDRGVCTGCRTATALTKDGTPRKHNDADGNVCAGADEQAYPELPWHVYGSEFTLDDITQHPVAIVGPVHHDPLTEIDHSPGQTLAYLGSYDHEPTHDDFMLIVPAAHAGNVPPGPGVSEAPPEGR